VKADLLINAEWIISVDPQDRVLAHHSLALANGRILEILPTPKAREQVEASEYLDLPGHALIPGLVNAHTHAAMALMRGLADDLPLMTWLNQHIWPVEQRWVREEFVLDGTRLAMTEMLRSGTTCFSDMYFFPEVTAQAVAEAGMRALIGLIAIDFPSAYAQDADDYVRKGLDLHDRYRDHALVRTAFAPHAPYSIGDHPLERIRILADELDIPVHMHLHETHDEVVHSLREHGERPMSRLDRLGLLGPNLIAVHMTQLEDVEIERFARSGAQVVHCPESNLKLASGFCPLARLHAAGINLALGTDGAASNNDLDMLGEVRTCALLAKGVASNAAVLPARTVLRMATLNGARALGLDAETGSLEPGKSADLVAIDLARPETLPVYDPLSQIVYASGREQVRHVWVAGRQLLRDGESTTLESESILHKAINWARKIAQPTV
jgi:5-methylthioadenosine/S-adenosylhomocysteine deaminase